MGILIEAPFMTLPDAWVTEFDYLDIGNRSQYPEPTKRPSSLLSSLGAKPLLQRCIVAPIIRYSGITASPSTLEKRVIADRIDPDATLAAEMIRSGRNETLMCNFVRQYGFPTKPKFYDSKFVYSCARFKEAAFDLLEVQNTLAESNAAEIEKLFNSRIVKKGTYQIMLGNACLTPVVRLESVWAFCTYELLFAHFGKRVLKHCENCGVALDKTRRSDARFCTTRCKVAAHRATKDAAHRSSASRRSSRYAARL